MSSKKALVWLPPNRVNGKRVAASSFSDGDGCECRKPTKYVLAEGKVLS